MANATFDGPNKLIILNTGVDEVDAQIDIYSDWKEWVIKSDNSKYLQALRTVGGDPIGAGQAISAYFFLLNGWRVRPYEGDQYLQIEGNLYVDGGGSPVVPTVGSYNVVASLVVSPQSITNTVEVTAAEAVISEADKEDIANKVWEETTSAPTSGTYGEMVNDIKTDTSLIPGTV